MTVLTDMGVKVVLHDLSGSVEELSIVDRARPFAVALGEVPEGPLARAAIGALVPLLREAGTVVLADGGDEERDSWLRAIGVDHLLPIQVMEEY